jgi:hypothetical protein
MGGLTVEVAGQRSVESSGRAAAPGRADPRAATGRAESSAVRGAALSGAVTIDASSDRINLPKPPLGTAR